MKKKSEQFSLKYPRVQVSYGYDGERCFVHFKF